MELGRNFVPASQQIRHGLLKNFQLFKSWIRIFGAQPLMGDKHCSTYGSFKGIKETFLLRVASHQKQRKALSCKYVFTHGCVKNFHILMYFQFIFKLEPVFENPMESKKRQYITTVKNNGERRRNASEWRRVSTPACLITWILWQPLKRRCRLVES